jgi:hypothetical protein
MDRLASQCELETCRQPFLGKVRGRPRRFCSTRCKRLRIYQTRERHQARYWEDQTDHCPLCEHQAPSTEALAVHMKTAHNRLILEYDMNRAVEARQAKYRAIQAEEDALLGVEAELASAA